MMLTFVVDAREDDVVGVRVLVLTGKDPKDVLQSFAKLAVER